MSSLFVRWAMLAGCVATGAMLGFVGLGVVMAEVPAGAAASGSGPTTRPYPLETCVVSGEKLGQPGTDEAPVVIQYEGREVRFCCRDCVDEFKKDPAKYTAKLDAAAASHGK